MTNQVQTIQSTSLPGLKPEDTGIHPSNLTNQDIARLGTALAVIPADARMGNHSAESVIGMALRHVSSRVTEDVGRKLCAQWDQVAGGKALSVFEKSDPNYSDRPPLSLSSIYRLARSHGWHNTSVWPIPTPLPEALPPVEAFSDELLPDELRDWVTDISHRMQCPPDFAAVSALVALSSLVGARAVVQPKALDSWQVVPNLWGVVVGRPGVKKSPAFSETLKPLSTLQEAENVVFKNAHDSWVLDCQLAAMQREANEREAKRLASTDPVAARALLQPPNMSPEPVARRYTVNDATVEKLGELLKQNPWGILNYRDELYGMLTGMDKPGQEDARAFMLQSYDGNQSYIFDRIGRGTVEIPRVCLSLVGGIQPGRIQEYVRGAVSGGSSDDGLLQRFGLAVWPDIDGEYQHVDQRPDAKAKESAWAVFHRLAVLEPADQNEAKVWRFTEEAQPLFNEWLMTLEAELRNDELHPALISHLSKYRKLIPALALLFALIDTPDSGNLIHPEELKRAIAMGGYLRSHANRLYSAATTPEMTGAASLLKKIKGKKLVNSDGTACTKFTPRQVAVKNWSGLRSPEAVRKAAEILVDYDYLRWEMVPVGVTGGRPSERYSINPEVHGGGFVV